MNDEDKRLRERVMGGACKRWNDAEMNLFAAQRHEFELSLINKGGWADYFLMVASTSITEWVRNLAIVRLPLPLMRSRIG